MRGDRAVSSAVTYTLVIAITLALTAGLVLGADSLVTSQRERTVQNQLEVTGQRLASAITAVDRLGGTVGAPTGANVTLEFPQRIAGVQYRIGTAHDPDLAGRNVTYLAADDVGVNVTVPVTVRWANHVDGGPINGGTVVVVYEPNDPDDAEDDQVVIRRAS
jgi:hypothetical protein